jgi:hypothetical protein
MTDKGESVSVEQVMDVLRAGLTPFVERYLKARYGAAWQSYARWDPRDGDFHWDVPVLIGTILTQWEPVFSAVMGPADRSLLHEVRDWRNRWAHQREIPATDVYRACDSAERLLLSVAAPEAARLHPLKRVLLRLLHEEEAERIRADEQKQRATEEHRRAEERETQRRRNYLAASLARQLTDSEGRLLREIRTWLNAQEGLRDVTTEDLMAYFTPRVAEPARPTTAPHTAARTNAPARTLDKPTVEVRGQEWVAAAIRDAGFVTARGERGILTVHAASDDKAPAVRQVRVYSASDAAFPIKTKHNDGPDALLVWVWHIGDPERTRAYAMTYGEALAIAEKKGWTQTNSWRDGGWSTTRPDRELLALLEPYGMTPEKWKARLSGEGVR